MVAGELMRFAWHSYSLLCHLQGVEREAGASLERLVLSTTSCQSLYDSTAIVYRSRLWRESFSPCLFTQRTLMIRHDNRWSACAACTMMTLVQPATNTIMYWLTQLHVSLVRTCQD
jgi:hypothetical protein